MKYGQAVRIIALTEKPKDLNFENICDYASVVLVSSIYNVGLETVAEDIIRIRSFTRENNLRFLKKRQKLVA